MRRTIATLLTVAALWPAGILHAQDSPDMEKWEGFLERAAAAYDAGDYEQALLLYGRARSIYDPPPLKYNAARIHQRLGECTAAKILYVELVESDEADSELRGKAAEQLASLGECGQSTSAATADDEGSDTSPSSGTSDEEVVSSVHFGREPASPGRKAVTWSLIGFGAASIVTGFGLAGGYFLPAWAADCYFDGSCDPDEPGETQADLQRSAENVVSTHRAAALVFLGAGLVSTVSGIIVHVTRPKTVERKRVWWSPAAGGIVVGGSF